MNAIKIEGLSMAFGQNVIFDNALIEVPHGKIVGLVGLNGSGKTTLLKIISGLLLPTSGVFSGICADGKSHRISVLSDSNRCLYLELTGRENIEYFSALKSPDGKPDRRKIDLLAELIGANDYLDRRTSTISKGMKQKLMIVIALLGSPELLILDEPINGLDFYSIQTLKQALFQLKDAKVTVLLTSHDRYFLDEICDEQLLISDKKIRPLQSSGEYNERMVRVFMQNKCPDSYDGINIKVEDAEKSIYSADVMLNNYTFWQKFGSDIETGNVKCEAIIDVQNLDFERTVNGEPKSSRGIKIVVERTERSGTK